MALSININGYTEKISEIINTIMRKCTVFTLTDSEGNTRKFYGGGGFCSEGFIIYYDYLRTTAFLEIEIEQVTNISVQNDMLNISIQSENKDYKLTGIMEDKKALCANDDIKRLKFPRYTVAKLEQKPGVIYIQTEYIANCGYREKMQIQEMLYRYGLFDNENIWVDKPLAIAFVNDENAKNKVKVGLIDRTTGEFITNTKTFLWQNYYNIA